MTDDTDSGRQEKAARTIRPPSPPSPPTDPQRRVYALPQEMVDRIVEFQKEKGYTSEVEAVRRLLDEALKSRDNLEKIINRYLSKLSALRVSSEAARDVLVGHPLVRSIEFDGGDVAFILKNGAGARIHESGHVRLIRPEGESWKWTPGDGPYEPGEVDEIPF